MVCIGVWSSCQGCVSRGCCERLSLASVAFGCGYCLVNWRVIGM